MTLTSILAPTATSHTVLAATATETQCGIASGARSGLATLTETEMENAPDSCMIPTTGRFVRAAIRRSRKSCRASPQVMVMTRSYFIVVLSVAVNMSAKVQHS